MSSFAFDIQRFCDLTKERASTVTRQTALSMLNSLIKRSPVDTGRFRGNWQTTIDTPAEVAKYSGSAAAAQVRALEGAVGAGTTETQIKTLVDNYWIPGPTPVVAIAAETHLAVANADGAELIGFNQATVLI